MSIVLGVAALTADLVIHPQFLGKDFINQWVAGKLALEGRADLAFNPTNFQHALALLRVPVLQNYSYPPHALFLAVPVALLPYYPALALWSIGGALFFTFAARPHVRFPVWLSSFTPAGVMCIWDGQYGLVLGGLWLLFFRFFERHPSSAGIMAAGLTFKPHLGLLVAVNCLRRPRVAIVATIATITLIALSILCFGWSAWHQFFTTTPEAQIAYLNMEAASSHPSMMPSPYVHLGLLGQIAVAAGAVLMLVRFRPSDPFSLSTATFLIIPYTFGYDMTVACLGFAIVLWDHWPSLKVWERVVVSAAFLSPLIGFVAGAVVPVLLFAALWVQCRALVPSRALEALVGHDATSASALL